METLKKYYTLIREHGGFWHYLRNTGWMFFAKTFNILISFFVSIYVTRYLGPEKYGMLSYAVSYVGIFSIISNIGIDQILFRELVLRKEEKGVLLGSAIYARFIGAVLAFSITLLSLLFLRDEKVIIILIAINALCFLLQPFQIINTLFQAETRSKYPSIVSVITVLILSIAKLTVIYFDKGVIWFSTVFLLEQVLYAIGYFIIYKFYRIERVKLSASAVEVKKFFIQALPLFLYSTLTVIYSRIDQVLIKQILQVKDVGLYDAGVRIAEMWFFIPGIIVTSYLPAILNKKNFDTRSYHRRIFRLTLGLTALSLLVSVGTQLFSTLAIKIIYGAAYMTSADVLRVYVWGGIGYSIAMLMSQYLIAENKTWLLIFTTCVGAVSNIVLNLYWIPQYGIVGAAYATAISYSLIPLSVFVSKEIRGKVFSALK